MTATASGNVAPPVDAPRAAAYRRDAALDFVKGALVIVMVAYHTMNVFSTAGPEAYAPIRFVTGSFIFIAGYVIARFQLDALRRDWRRTSLRLVERGVKLVLLFTALNVAINLTGLGNPDKVQRGVGDFVQRLYAFYVAGDPVGTSFLILLPIGYLMIVSPALLALNRFKGPMLTVAVAAVLSLQWLRIEVPNLDLALIGVVGIASGLIARECRRPIAISKKGLLLACLVFSFALAAPLSTQPFTYVLSIVIIVKLLYDTGAALRPDAWIVRALDLLGRFSLVAYIAQIVLLQAFAYGTGRPRWELGPYTLLVGLAACLTLWALIALLELVLQRSSFAARCYKLVFS